MQVNEQNIGAVIVGMEQALKITQEKEAALQSVLKQTSAADFDLEKFCRAIGGIVKAQLSHTIAEVEGLKVQIEELKTVKRHMDSGIVVPQPPQPQESKIVLS